MKPDREGGWIEMRFLATLLLVIAGCVAAIAAPAGAVTYSLDESVIIQPFSNIPGVRTSGMVLVCEAFQNFGLGCTAPAQVSDFLNFIPLTTSTQVNFCSDTDTDIFGAPAGDFCGTFAAVAAANTGAASAVAENFITGGFTYTPGAATDPGWNPAPAATQDSFTFAGDPEDMTPTPEASSGLLVSLGLSMIPAIRRVTVHRGRRAAQ